MSSKLKLSLIIYCGTVFLLHLAILNVRQSDKVHEWCTDHKFVKGRITKTVKAYWSSGLFVFDVLLGKEPDTRQLTWNGSGQAVSKAISCAEIMKRQFKVRRDALQHNSCIFVLLLEIVDNCFTSFCYLYKLHTVFVLGFRSYIK